MSRKPSPELSQIVFRVAKGRMPIPRWALWLVADVGCWVIFS